MCHGRREKRGLVFHHLVELAAIFGVIVAVTPTVPDAGRATELPRQTVRSAAAADGLHRLRIRTIVLDAGHGGWDRGAVYGNAVEKEINLSIAQKLLTRMSRHQRLRVFLTRRGDYYLPLRERTLIANQYSADLFISIHCNASPNKTARGFETYFCSETASDDAAARVAAAENAAAQKEVAKILPANYIDIEEWLFKIERKLYWEDSRNLGGQLQQTIGPLFHGAAAGLHSADFVVLRHAQMPALLIEIGYLSHKTERALLNSDDYQDQIADKIWETIQKLL